MEQLSQQQYNIAQFATNMAIKEMPLDDKNYENFTKLATGKKRLTR